MAAIGLLALGVTVALAKISMTVDVAKILAHTPQVERVKAPDPSIAFPYYELTSTHSGGYVIPSLVSSGRLPNGQDVLIVPLDSGGSGEVFAALIWTRLQEAWRFVGSVRSPDGRLVAEVKNGELIAISPKYGPNDADCCPSQHRYVEYTIAGTRLERLRAHVAK